MQRIPQDGAGYGAGQSVGAGFGPGGERQTTLAPGARIAGALICVVLLGVEIAWSVRDIRDVGLHGTVWRWLQLDPIDYTHGPIATSALDPLLVVLLAGALVASRRSSASGAFATAGIFAVLFRMPGLWEFDADWTRNFSYHDRLLSTSIVFVVLGLGLIVTVLAAQRPAEPVDAAMPVLPGGSPGVPAVRPMAGAAVVAGLLLILLAAETAGWQFYYIHEYGKRGFPPHLYRHLVTGGPGILTSFLDTPPFWQAWVSVPLALFCAAVAFARLPLARPLAMATGLYFALGAVVALDQWHKEDLLFTFDKLSDAMAAQQMFLVLEIAAGLLLMLLAALRGRRTRAAYGAAGRPGAGWGAGYGAAPGAPGAPFTPAAPYTYGAPGAPGTPGGSGGPGGSPGGYGYPAAGGAPQRPPGAGGFGPPPSFPPPPAAPGPPPNTPNVPPPPSVPPTVG